MVKVCLHVKDKSLTPALRQFLCSAIHVKKNGRSHYGYKNHVNADRKHKLIRTFAVTDASVHDSQAFQAKGPKLSNHAKNIGSISKTCRFFGL